MDTALWLTALTGLGGVGLGGLLSFRTQERGRLHQERQAWRETRRLTYGALVSAVRQYRLHVLDPRASVEVRIHANGQRLVPILDAAGVKYQELMEASHTEVNLVARGGEVIDAAHVLTTMARRVAVARRIYGVESVPVAFDGHYFRAERAFVNSARRDLELPEEQMGRLPDIVSEIDSDLMEAFREGGE
ncbi:hypothetical protein [Streptomyces sp. Agncl-13]|uniref:hypothetical protein n=1 Tax=Streptomyces sp. Agncl-13 TaxID=3400628 RepID=UPI003A894B69